jgi:TetR/AcrR family transcriptional regulator
MRTIPEIWNCPEDTAKMGVLPARISTTATASYGKTRGGEANVERILDAALSIFAVDGFTGARVDAIAELAGLSKPNLLYYFRTKADLYLAVLRRMLDLWLEPLYRMEASDDPKSALTDYITRKLEQARDYPEASRLFAMEVMRGAPILNKILAGELKTLVDEKVLILRGWMEAGHLSSRDPHQMLFMIWASTQHFADFSAQVEVLTGKSLADKDFFAQTREAILLAHAR